MLPHPGLAQAAIASVRVVPGHSEGCLRLVPERSGNIELAEVHQESNHQKGCAERLPWNAEINEKKTI
jgi:hypothetical protein